MTPEEWVLVVLTGVLLPLAGFMGGALASKRHWTTVLRDRWHQGLTTGRETASNELERLLWKEVKNLRARLRSGMTGHGDEYVNGWEDACTHLTHLVERLVDDDDGAL